MTRAISNTSPLQYLYRAGAIHWLPQLFEEIITPEAVKEELEEGLKRGYDVPEIANYDWLQLVNPKYTPSQWLSLDLGAGELAAMSLALEKPSYVLLLDDMLARRTAQAAGLTVWGTLRVILEAKSQGFTDKVEPTITILQQNGMWISTKVRHRILRLAGEMK
jgi:predicted nucleic acid-binding protein